MINRHCIYFQKEDGRKSYFQSDIVHALLQKERWKYHDVRNIKKIHLSKNHKKLHLCFLNEIAEQKRTLRDINQIKTVQPTDVLLSSSVEQAKEHKSNLEQGPSEEQLGNIFNILAKSVSCTN